MKHNYKIGDKVKMSCSAAEWILAHPECWQNPITGELVDYDGPVINAMLTLMGEPPIGTLTAQGLEQGNYFVKYPNDHTSVYESNKDFYPASKVEIELNLTKDTLDVLKKIADLSGVSKHDVLAVLLTAKTLKEGAIL